MLMCSWMPIAEFPEDWPEDKPAIVWLPIARKAVSGLPVVRSYDGQRYISWVTNDSVSVYLLPLEEQPSDWLSDLVGPEYQMPTVTVDDVAKIAQGCSVPTAPAR